MADSESIQDRLLSIFPLESPDGDFSVQLVEVDREADQEVRVGFRVVFRVVHWNVLPDGPRSVETIHEQPILFGVPDDSVDAVVREVIASSFAAQAILAAHHPDAGFAPALLFGGVPRWPLYDVPQDGWSLATPLGELDVGAIEERGDSLWATVRLTRPDAERSIEVLWMDFPDERDPEVRSRYDAAMLGIVWALMTMAPGPVVAGLSLEDWFDARLVDDPANTTVADLVRAWLARPPAGAMVDAWVAQL